MDGPLLGAQVVDEVADLAGEALAVTVDAQAGVLGPHHPAQVVDGAPEDADADDGFGLQLDVEPVAGRDLAREEDALRVVADLRPPRVGRGLACEGSGHIALDGGPVTAPHGGGS